MTYLTRLQILVVTTAALELSAAVLTFQDGTDGYDGTADTFLRSTTPAVAYGKIDRVWVANSDNNLAPGTVQGLLKFDRLVGNGSNQIPFGAKIQSVTLHLHSELPTGSSSDAINLHRMIADWTDGDTWSSMGEGISADNKEASAKPDATFIPSNKLPFTLALETTGLLATVQAWVDGTSPNRGWALLPTGADDYWFNASESASIKVRPALTIGYLTPPPSIRCPGNLLAATDPGQCTKSNLIFTVDATDYLGKPLPVKCVPSSGSTFPAGVTLVDCTATDATGNSSHCSFSITIQDGEPPQVVCPPRIIARVHPGSSHRQLTFAASATDNCDPNVLVICQPPSGSLFPVGTTTVACKASDKAGNSSECQFTVTVAEDKQPITVLAETGASIILCAADESNSPGSYQWRKSRFPLPGATNGCLTLDNIPIEDGGEYDVVTRQGATEDLSAAFFLVPGITDQPAGSDSFGGRKPVDGKTGAVRGTTAEATREPEEPFHAARLGNHSVWYTWAAPATGIATFNTRGSACDTLLAVYVGTDLAKLGAVALDDNSGGFYSSEVQFNARAATVYSVAVDAMADPGPFLLSWSLEVTADQVPVLLSTPVLQTVEPGGSALFSVIADAPNASYQWFFKGQPIAGATSGKLVVEKVQPDRLGVYSVRVRTSSARSIWAGADLQIGPCPAAGLYDDIRGPLSLECAPTTVALQARTSSSPTGALLTQGFVAVGLGQAESASGDISSFGGSREAECGGVMSRSGWLLLQPASDGILTIDTSGSANPAVVSVYELLLSFPWPRATNRIACDFTSMHFGAQARLCLPVKADSNLVYGIEVGGLGSAAGLVQVNYQLLPPDTFLVLERFPTPDLVEVTCCTTNLRFSIEAAKFLSLNGWQLLTDHEGLCSGFRYTEPVSTISNRFFRARSGSDVADP